MNPIDWPTPAREQHFAAWLSSLAAPQGLLPGSAQLAGIDTDTRRYLRVLSASGNAFLVLDAPPDNNDLRRFVTLAAHLLECGLHVPTVLAVNETQGFLLLSDPGSPPYLPALLAAQAAELGQELPSAEASRLMRGAIQTLIQWQLRGDASRLPLFDETLVRGELQGFVDWCVQREHGRQWDESQLKWWEHSCRLLVQNCLEQPQLAMHRNFTPRHLMLSTPAVGQPGLLEFQDAACGPISYDLASLLRDTGISWDEEQELDWAVRYWEQARKAGLPVNADFGEFWRQLEWSGLQRHLMLLGRFCRLKHRDGKPGPADDLPRLFAYAIKVSTRYVQLSPLTHLLEELRGKLVETGFTLR